MEVNMKNSGLFELFIRELEDVYSFELQIVEALPKMIKHVSLDDLKEALRKHLHETEQQVKRVEKIFSILGFKPKKVFCEGMKGILDEGEHLIGDHSKSAALDAAIICSAQKVEHYEISVYGTLKSFAKHLNFDTRIINLLDETLDEEANADKKLTKIADGTFFSSGVNQEAVATR
jgi:ferritin-like metal-binding protein YciE